MRIDFVNCPHSPVQIQAGHMSGESDHLRVAKSRRAVRRFRGVTAKFARNPGVNEGFGLLSFKLERGWTAVISGAQMPRTGDISTPILDSIDLEIGVPHLRSIA